MHLNGPFYGENRLNFKKYESAYLFTTSKIHINSSETQTRPYHNILPTVQYDRHKITQYNDKKQNPRFGNPIQKGPCQNSFTKQTQYHKTKQLKKRS